MAQVLTCFRWHWQALFVSLFFMWRLWRGDFESNLAMWIVVGLVVVGMVMDLTVILINRGMPAGVTPEEIPEDERPHYHPISQSNRLAILSDWIPVGNLLISHGDIVLFIAVAILLVDATVGF